MNTSNPNRLDKKKLEQQFGGLTFSPRSTSTASTPSVTINRWRSGSQNNRMPTTENVEKSIPPSNLGLSKLEAETLCTSLLKIFADVTGLNAQQKLLVQALTLYFKQNQTSSDTTFELYFNLLQAAAFANAWLINSHTTEFFQLLNKHFSSLCSQQSANLLALKLELLTFKHHKNLKMPSELNSDKLHKKLNEAILCVTKQMQDTQEQPEPAQISLSQLELEDDFTDSCFDNELDLSLLNEALDWKQLNHLSIKLQLFISGYINHRAFYTAGANKQKTHNKLCLAYQLLQLLNGVMLEEKFFKPTTLGDFNIIFNNALELNRTVQLGAILVERQQSHEEFHPEIAKQILNKRKELAHPIDTAQFKIKTNDGKKLGNALRKCLRFLREEFVRMNKSLVQKRNEDAFLHSL